MADTGGYIYAIRAEGTPYIKIGSTKGSPAKRLKNLQTGQPFTLTILAAASLSSDVQQVERSIHRFLHDKKQQGEWFAIDPLNESSLAILITEAVAYVEREKEQQGLEQEQKRRERLCKKNPRVAASSIRERLPIFQERLLLTRRQQGLSQKALAARAGLFLTDISKYERGQSMPALPRLVRLAQALHCSADWLLGLAPHHDADTPPQS